ncbi:MAG: hypothetical protein AAF514_10020 [Verrucomicrobiota bacterium]
MEDPLNQSGSAAAPVVFRNYELAVVGEQPFDLGLDSRIHAFVVHDRTENELGLLRVYEGSDRKPFFESPQDFEKFARAAGQFSNPGLLSMKEFGHDDGMIFSVHAFTPCEKLAHYINRVGPVYPKYAVDLTLQLINLVYEIWRQPILHGTIDTDKGLIISEEEGRLVVQLSRFYLPAKEHYQTRDDFDRIWVPRILTFLKQVIDLSLAPYQFKSKLSALIRDPYHTDEGLESIQHWLRDVYKTWTRSGSDLLPSRFQPLSLFARPELATFFENHLDALPGGEPPTGKIVVFPKTEGDGTEPEEAPPGTDPEDSATSATTAAPGDKPSEKTLRIMLDDSVRIDLPSKPPSSTPAPVAGATPEPDPAEEVQEEPEVVEPTALADSEPEENPPTEQPERPGPADLAKAAGQSVTAAREQIKPYKRYIDLAVIVVVGTMIFLFLNPEFRFFLTSALGFHKSEEHKLPAHVIETMEKGFSEDTEEE